MTLIYWFITAISWLVCTVLISVSLKRWQMPDWLRLFLSSVIFGVLHGIVTIIIPDDSVRLFLNPIAVSTVNRMHYYPDLAEYFLVTLVMHTIFGILISIAGYTYRDYGATDFWRR